jgi:phosphomannomutase
MAKSIQVESLMVESGVKFGTSGARGLASEMTDEVCYLYTMAFIQHLERMGELKGEGSMAVGGDLRPSTDRIMGAAARAVTDRGYTPIGCGKLPSPALAYYGLVHNMPTVMVTGSHIPDDRNGIKYTRKKGEILKADETAIKQEMVVAPDGLFDDNGMFTSRQPLLNEDPEAVEMYVSRHLDFFPENCLKGKRIGVYQHSAVGRELMVEILKGLGAHVTPLGFSDVFVPVDTEAIRPEDVKAARKWAGEYGFDAIVSTDGDTDRPLISDETGEWLRGDVAGILTAAYFGADAVATPVSCNSALEKSGWFETVFRTRIGSPYVIEGMEQARNAGAERVVGYEANGGFLIASNILQNGKTLRALPTRDAIMVHLAILLLSIQKGKKISALMNDLPRRFTHSNRLKAFPTGKSLEALKKLYGGDAEKDRQAIETVFGSYFGQVRSVDTTDGLRITFQNDEVVHLRPSGNAPEFRCYNEADTAERAEEMNEICMKIMMGWR